MSAPESPSEALATRKRRCWSHASFALAGFFVAVLQWNLTVPAYRDFAAVAYAYQRALVFVPLFGISGMLLAFTVKDGILRVLSAATILLLMVQAMGESGVIPAPVLNGYARLYALTCLIAPLAAYWIKAWPVRLLLWGLLALSLLAISFSWHPRSQEFVWHRTTEADRQLLDAAMRGDLRAIELALARGAMVAVKDDEGQDAVWWASEKGHAEAVELLLRQGADPAATDALSIAAMRGHANVVRALLRGGIDPNGRRARDALVSAALAGQTENVKTLVASGIHLTSRTEAGITTLEAALEAARTYDSTKTIEFLETLQVPSR